MTEPNDAIVAFSDIGKRYGNRAVLDRLDLAIPAGRFTVVYGPPASGKSVLFRLLMGLEAPDAGRIVLRGEDVANVAAADRNIGYVPQSFALYPHLSVRDNIAYPLTLAGIGAAEAEPVVQRAAEMLKIGDLLGKRPDQLSGGQKQRVAIARGIAKQTEFFVLDDPLAGLDFKLREQLVEDLHNLQTETNATFLYATSDAVEALTLADWLAVLDGGRIIDQGEPDALYHDPAHARTMALVGFPPANFVTGRIEPRDGRLWCRTASFAAPVELAVPPPEVAVVGVRPENLALHAAGDASRDGRGDEIRLDARVVLREDLGGEEIVYLDVNGTPLTSIDRLHQRFADIDGRLAVSVQPTDLLLFSPTSGERIGRGAAAAPPAAR
ncbi:MAG TPA: ABC transporter ATP-binding protein [Thermomicrobiales bacterium]|nr:ABC transporter ATP-binding protein [Thermomicrobiales bacterium]